MEKLGSQKQLLKSMFANVQQDYMKASLRRKEIEHSSASADAMRLPTDALNCHTPETDVSDLGQGMKSAAPGTSSTSSGAKFLQHDSGSFDDMICGPLPPGILCLHDARFMLLQVC